MPYSVLRRGSCTSDKHRFPRMIRFPFRLSLFLSTLLFVILPSCLHGQALESYIDKKKSERMDQNRFLRGASGDELNQLRTYYRRAFSEQQTEKGFQFGPGMNNATDASAQQLSSMTLSTLDGAVDANTYMLGPMDVLSINLWGDIPTTATTVVTPEGSVLVPTVGEVDVRSLSLRRAKERIEAEVRKRYSKVSASVTLISPRTFSVHVTGVVPAPGSYGVTASDRADRAVYMASVIKPSKSIPRSATEEKNDLVSFNRPMLDALPNLSLRNILIFRNGDTVRVDLMRYYATGDLQYNPRLLDGDVLFVPPEALDANKVSVYGGVRLPGSFEYNPSDSLRLLLRMAQGFTENAITDTIEIARFPDNGGMLETVLIDGEGIRNGTFDVALQRNDRVFIRERANLRAEYTVSVKGEVRFNGSYPITREATKLSEIINRAGGFTADASVAEGLIFRQNQMEKLDPVSKIPDYTRLVEMRLSGMDREERDYFTYESAIDRNFVSVDFRKLFLEHDASADVTLRDGDQIVIPATSHSVYVFGQVVRPGHITFVPGMDDAYYIAKAGGVAESADRGGRKIVKAGSKAWVDPGDTKIEAGDAIFIPRNPERDFAFYFTAIRDFLTVAVSAVTIYLLVKQIQRN